MAHASVIRCLRVPGCLRPVCRLFLYLIPLARNIKRHLSALYAIVPPRH
jgi:hypothetical protein